MRWILRIALLLLVLVVAGIGALFLLPSDRIAQLAEDQFLENTGRKLELSGEVSPQLFPRLGVALEGVSIENASWAGDDPMLEADRLELSVDLMSLVSGEIVVEAANVVNPVIRLEQQADGTANWDFVTELGGEEESSGGETPNISLPKALVSGGTLEFRDAASGQTTRLDDLNVELALADIAGVGELSLSAVMEGQPFAVAGQINGVKAFLDGAVSGVDATFTVGGASIGFAGNAGLDPLQVKGNLDANLADHPALFALIGQSPPVIPAGLGQQARITGEVTMTDGTSLFMRGLDIALDQNRLSGDVDVDLSGAPVVTARLTAGDLDFSAMSTDTTEGDGAANTGSGGWSNAALDVSGLAALNGELAFKANSVDLGSIKIVNADMRGSLDNSRLVLDLTNVGAFDGAVAGQFVVNGRGGLSVGGDLRAQGVSMQRVLADFAGFDRLIGDAQMQLKFLGVGNTMDKIMRSLSGQGSLAVGAGELRGLDIGGMIRNLDASFEGEGSSTVFDAISASYVIDGGVLRNSDLDFRASLLTATGEGTLDIGAQSVNYRIDPIALSDQTGGFGVPVLITGPWANVKFRPDLKALADRELAEEKEKLKAAAAAKLEEELGVDLDGATSVEEAVKDKLEDRAKDALRGLFGD